MRFHLTLAFTSAEQAWREAYAAYDVLAEAGADGTPAYDAACKAETDALNALLLMPAITPKEIARKLEIIDERYDTLGVEDLADEFAAIRRDLDLQTRPTASPDIAAAFAAWAAAYQAHDTSEGHADDSPEEAALSDADTDAYRALMQTPCTTPGDFLVKVYANLLSDNGGTYRSHEPSRSTGFSFELEAINVDHRYAPGGGLQLDAEAEVAHRADLLGCDLGVCMSALGRVDFDAEAWIAAADRWGHGFYVTVDDAGEATGFGQNVGGSHSGGDEAPGWTPERETMLMQLLAGGLAEGPARIKAVVAATVANHPEHIVGAAARVPVEA